MRPERFRVLAASIRAELANIARAVNHAGEALNRSERDAEDREFLLEAAAFNVHSAYTAIERLLQEIARVVDETQPSSGDWHRELVRQMTLAPTGIRPAVLSMDVAGELQEVLRFRHLVRNIYISALDPGRVAANVHRLIDLRDPLEEALLAFATWLDSASDLRP
jgi:hypothetical protein